MKAWIVRIKEDFSATVVFAETRGKAKSTALGTDACCGADFIDIEVRRCSKLDKYYVDGKQEMYWDIPKDRLALIKECGFVCNPDYREPRLCEDCSGKEYCDTYLDSLIESKNTYLR